MEFRGGSLAVALMAGGKSTRMGLDKAVLTGPDGRELWKNRLLLLQELGASEVIISCRKEQGYLAASGARLVFDEWENAGPLGGMVSCLVAMKSERLLVLAVDLPGMTRAGLDKLVAAAMAGDGTFRPGLAEGVASDASSPLPGARTTGAVFRSGGFLEPLVAVYPKWMSESGRRRLEEGDFALRGWIAEAGAAMREVETPVDGAELFVNINDPATWHRWTCGGVRGIPAGNG